MIVDHIKNYSRYTDCSGNIKKALEFLANEAQNPELEDGTYVLIPDEVIAHVITKDSHNRYDADMEIHKKFMDIHYIIEGGERCGVAPLAEDISYDENTDNGFYACDDTYDVVIQKGEFYAVWPMEPHCPLCNIGNQQQKVKKVICKVKID
ncbi:MAG: YhcH/YjgK/YiaL family protein [Eubacteriales bacterium]|nr:YhcH/YjgK/YiaL family protein [Eubacteriales bacterium]